MAETNATILIPDISGFTEFITTTELTHSSKAINILIDAILKAVGEEYEVLEVEGDAVLMIKKGPVPSQKEIQEFCLKIFNAFHFQRKCLQLYTVCPCRACQALSNLALKFVVHYGPLSEIKMGRFSVHSGTEMIVAHRLMKNSIANNEYLLMTEKLLQQVSDSSELGSPEWIRSSEEYASIGKVNYRFSLLNEARKNIPEPPAPPVYPTDDTAYLETLITANFFDVYMAMMDIPNRPNWMTDLQKVEPETPDVFVGSIHYCSFEDYQAILSPLRMSVSDGEFIYAESCQIKELNLSLVHEFVFRNIDDSMCGFKVRFMNAGDSPVSEEIKALLEERMRNMTENLKTHCEKIKNA